MIIRGVGAASKEVAERCYTTEGWKRELPRGLSHGGVHQTPAVTYSRPRRTTIGPGRLTAVFGMGTGVAARVCPPGMSKGGGRGCVISPCPSEGGVNAAKRSAVSTGPLSVLPHLHARPIDPVFYRGPSPLKGAGDLFWRGVSRLDAFSVYPGRT